MNENAVSIKLPQFWPETPEFWFIQTEAQFALRGIKDENTKYSYVVSAIDQDVAKRVMDFIKTPPNINRYEEFKKRLLSTYCLSESERAQKLLNMPELGDEKPSKLMHNMQVLLGDHQPCFLFRELFLQKMPENIKTALVSMQITNCRKLATAADELFNSQSNLETNAVRAFPQHTAKATVKKNRSGFCYFHEKFGDKAFKCQFPCSFKRSGNDKADRQ